VGIAGEELEEAKGFVSRCVRGIVGREFIPANADNTGGIEISCRRCDQMKICRWA